MAAAFWISNKFKNAELLPLTPGYASHFTTPTGAHGHNIMGMIPGSYTVPVEKYIIVGAHYDHLGTLDGKLYPGADANASGTAVLTSLADIFAEMKLMGKVYDTSIIFVAFDAKEMGMAGSAYMWKLIDYGMLKDPLTEETITKEKITAMVNIDQIGSSLSPIHSSRRDYMLMLGNESLPKNLRMNLEADICSIDLDDAASHLGEITGTTVNDEVIDNIFKNFCIGK